MLRSDNDGIGKAFGCRRQFMLPLTGGINGMHSRNSHLGNKLLKID